ncbi:MAG: hypothetical protein ACUVQS_02105 [Candidatus Bipolaricaulaceae bacterium]
MYRWVLVACLLALVGILSAFFWLGWKALHEGLMVQVRELSAPLEVTVGNPVVLRSPVEVQVISLPLAIPARFSVGVEGPVQADTGLLRCPRCGEGTLLPVRINLFSGEIRWRCTTCGEEFGP